MLVQVSVSVMALQYVWLRMLYCSYYMFNSDIASSLTHTLTGISSDIHIREGSQVKRPKEDNQIINSLIILSRWVHFTWFDCKKKHWHSSKNTLKRFNVCRE